MSKDDELETPDGTMHMDAEARENVLAMHAAGPGALAQELYMRDLVVAKLLTKLGIDKIDLHSMNDAPAMHVPLKVDFIVGGAGIDEGRIVTVQFKTKKAGMH